MGFMNELVTFGSPSAAAGTGSWAPDDDRYYGGSPSIMSNAGRSVSPDTAMKFAAVYQCVTLRAKLFASLPFEIDMIDPKTKKRSSAPNHPIYDLLKYQPNKWQTAWDFKCMMNMHLDLRGNAYAEIIAGPRGFADSLEPLHPDLVIPEQMSDGSIRYRVTDRLGKHKVLLADEVLHIRGPHAPGIAGISVVRNARETIGLALAAEEFGSRTFSNGARPSGVVTVPKGLTDAAFERFKSEWRGTYNGLNGAGATPILEDGSTFTAISMTSNDAQFLATREFQIEEICRWFDVPPILLHHQSKTSSWGTGVEAIMLAFTKNSFSPLIECWTQVIRRDLILAPRLYHVRFDTEKLTQGDSKAQADYLSRLVLNGVITRNEAREYLGYDPMDGLDEPLVPSNTTTSDNLPNNGGTEPKQSALLGADIPAATLESAE
jgi:HK97 family phage portal protein